MRPSRSMSSERSSPSAEEARPQQAAASCCRHGWVGDVAGKRTAVEPGLDLGCDGLAGRALGDDAGGVG